MAEGLTRLKHRGCKIGSQIFSYELVGRQTVIIRVGLIAYLTSSDLLPALDITGAQIAKMHSVVLLLNVYGTTDTLLAVVA